ncbi:hypothetical protein K437DRAFT_272030 [Tilletiaria anomala UBC 951]|uniref:Uncharacterized protein n=1 Tax=Tilletiaria anomala (strain ATCC 24038 / CBS 436.72 / UBC 951) TaxID=1037660 RepID=A0A066WK83_TILAU|nr:uncharacterized protein K437DRAFT_272030 [Tilletiaria anomala UBC 951]KDN52978.1 hypothetical protein K437DRAFT_272030 [Tilletiaria anomala UBC 951]
MSDPASSSFRGGRSNAPPSQSTPPARNARASGTRSSPRNSRNSQASATAAATKALRSTPDASRAASPGTAFGALSASKEARENAERMHLNALLTELNGQIDALRSQLENARQQNASRASEKEKQMQQIAGLSSAELVMDDEIDALLKGMDDDALTALLVSSPSALMQKLIGSNESAATVSLAASAATASTETQAFVSVPAPALSAGIEGSGAGYDIDTRLVAGDRAARAPASKRRRTDGGVTQDSPTNDAWVEKEHDLESYELDKYQWMEDWLNARKRRGQDLLENLQAFTGWRIQSLMQKKITSADRMKSTRAFDVAGWLHTIGAIRVKLTVKEERASGPPKVSELTVELPKGVISALNQESHLDRLLRRCDAPAVFNTLRSLSSAARARRKLFQAVATQLRPLCGTKAYAVNAEAMFLASRWNHRRHKSGRSNHNRLATDLNMEEHDLSDQEAAQVVYDPEQAETLILSNDNNAQLHLRYRIAFDAFGRGLPDVSLTAKLPDSTALSPEADEILRAIPTQFRRMVDHRPGLEGETEAQAIESIVLSIAACFFGVTL